MSLDLLSRALPCVANRLRGSAFSRSLTEWVEPRAVGVELRQTFKGHLMERWVLKSLILPDDKVTGRSGRCVGPHMDKCSTSLEIRQHDGKERAGLSAAGRFRLLSQS